MNIAFIIYLDIKKKKKANFHSFTPVANLLDQYFNIVDEIWTSNVYHSPNTAMGNTDLN